MKLTTKLAVALVVLFTAGVVNAQQETSPPEEKRVALGEATVAHDGDGTAALQATLRTTSLNGGPDDPVTNVRIVVRNTSANSYAFVSGVVTFYDSAGIRCGEGIFKSAAVAPNESFDTDTPGLRIRCQATTWRMVALNLIPLLPPNPPPSVPAIQKP
ncbi:MAG TPA: hypothetical protein VFZ22_19560 [Pyrinomonadaceae bacterium]|nr:hypothetical protein [Pyrinomonadaceae bacterium]